MSKQDEVNPEAGAMLLRAVEDQLASNETPEVKREFDRLVATGVSSADAKEMMAVILSFHLTRMVKRGDDFDYPAYVTELQRLPEIDYDAPL